MDKNVTVVCRRTEGPWFPVSSYMCCKILSCNAHMAWSFSEAFIDIIPMQNEDEDVFFFPLYTLIPNAYSFLKRGLSGVQIANPESVNKDQKKAFDCLLKFLQNQEDHAKKLQAVRNEGLNETEICCVLAVHLFSQLVSEGQVIVDSKMKGIDKFQTCPCKCGKMVNTGNTGIGNPKVWHGNPDIMIEAGGTTVVMQRTDDDDDDDEEGPSIKLSKLDEDDEDDEDDSLLSVEVKTEQTDVFDYKFQNQLFSQTLTNAFVQKNQDNFSKKFIPAIGCTNSKMIIALYDPDQDILLRRVAPIYFLAEKFKKFDFFGILELWRVLNLHVLGAELPEQIVPELEKSGFKSWIESKNVLHYYSTAKTSISSGQNMISSPPLLSVMDNVWSGKFVVKELAKQGGTGQQVDSTLSAHCK